MEFNLADLFESVVDVVPDREALTYVDTPGSGDVHRLTYGELDALANRIAHHLLDSGLRRGDHVGIQMYNGVEYVAGLLALLKARLVPVNINYRYVEDELAHLYGDADLKGLLFDAEFAARVAAVLPRTPALRTLLQAGDTPAGTVSPAGSTFAEVAVSAPPDRDFGPRSADDLFLICTGGTTGMPKGVMWRQEDLFFAAMGGGAPNGTPVSRPEEVAERVAASGEGLAFFPAPPLMHGTSIFTLFIAFHFGQRVVVHRKFEPVAVLGTVARERVTSVSVVADAMLRPLIDALRGPAKGTDLSSLFAVSSSGAALAPTVRDEFREVAPTVTLLNNFGSSESGFNGTATDDGSTGSSGVRMEVNGRTMVVDLGTYEPVAPGVPGRIAQRGHVPLGYYNDPVKSAETFFERNGERWVLLGDMATVDESGIVTVLGRGSQCINTGGEKVYPEEVEQALKAHPAVYDVLVAGVPDPKWGSHVAAVVEIREGVAAPTLLALQDHCRGRLAGYKIPRQLVVAERIRRSPSGKADYRWARAVAEESADA